MRADWFSQMKKKILQRQAFLLALSFAVFQSLLEEWSFQNPQGYQLLRNLEQGGAGWIWSLITSLVSFFLLTFFVWFALSLPRRWRWAPFVVFSLAVVVVFNYWRLFHREFVPGDITTAITAPLAMWNASLSIYFSPLSMLPLLIFGGILCLPGQPAKKNALGLTAALTICVLLNTLAAQLAPAVNWGTSLPKFYRTVVQWSMMDVRYVPRLQVDFNSASRPENNIVLIIDESIRSDHLSLNGYERPTTPFLDELAATTDLIHNWGTISAGATCSTPSNPLLISGVIVQPESQEEIHGLMRQNPTIFQYAKAMGYQTLYVDAQTNYLWNGLRPEDLQYVDEWITVDDLGGGLDVDHQAADLIFNRVSRSNGYFIVLNKHGAHYLYENSYPPEKTIWGPAPTDYHQQPELVSNVYDNSIHYTVNGFFEHLRLNEEAATHNTFYLYTSDHAQTLFENGVNWLHCNYTKTEASVPLILIGNLQQPLDVTYAASHANIFATLLDLMNVPQNVRLLDYAPSLFDAHAGQNQPRFFLSGGGHIIPFD